jgi:hypothetical protein
MLILWILAEYPWSANIIPVHIRLLELSSYYICFHYLVVLLLHQRIVCVMLCFNTELQYSFHFYRDSNCKCNELTPWE